MTKKVLILKESELVLLIQGTVKDIQNEQYTPILLTPSIALTTNLLPLLTDIADWFYKVFIECEDTLDCIQNGLDAIAIVAAFIPGPGWFVSILAGLSSAGISLSKGDYAMGSAMVVFELFPITRIGKRIFSGIKAAKAADVDRVMTKMLDNGFNAKTYKTLKGTDKEIADYVLRNVDDISDDVMKAVKELKNNKAAKDLMKLTNHELKLVAQQVGSNYANLKIAVEMMRSQAKNIDDYMKFFNSWRRVATEVFFIGGMITAGLGTYLGVSYIMLKFFNNDEDLYADIKRQIEEAGGDVVEDLLEEFALCVLLTEIRIMLNTDCATWFKKWLTRTDGDGAFFDVPEYEDMEDLFTQYISQFDEEDMYKEMKRIFDFYGGQDACVYLKTTPGKTYESIWLDYYMETRESGECDN